MKLATRLLHSIPTDPQTGAIAVPIYQTSTFVQQAPGINQGYDYARSGNPTRKALEDLVAKLEGGTQGFAFASGLAAIDAVIKLLQAGDEIIAVDDIYGGAFRQFTHIFQKFGISVTYVDTTTAENLLDAFTPATKLIWLETPTNPTLKISDISKIAQIAKAHNCLLCVDNTFASPVGQTPLQLGADLVVHSATKYLAGHSDLIAGIVVTASAELAEKVKFIQNASGAVLGPFDSWLTIRGIETLPLRFKQHSKNAQRIAEYLSTESLIRNVYYPGLPTHPNYEVARRQQTYFGGVISFDLEEDSAALATQIVCSTRFFKLAESLGGVKSLCCHPATMTHKSIPRETRYLTGVTDSLIRLSVGLEDAEDLIEDLKAVFSTVKQQAKATAKQIIQL